MSATETRRGNVHGRSRAPEGRSRLLAGWHEERAPAGLREHLERHGDLPRLGRRDAAGLVTEIERAGLRGRGGAGFPTHRKLEALRTGGRHRVLVANGMEGEPASAKDRVLLSMAPHLVLDGAALAAAAIGADRIHVCVPRGPGSPADGLERALAERERTRTAIVPVRIHELPHRYVAGEETSVVNWLNGGPAKPTTTPPRPFERGVAGRPTLVQNVETLAHIALIARFGADWFRRQGTAEEPGSLLVSVVRSERPICVLEVPVGTTVGRVAALANPGVETQAVLVGGYSGSWFSSADAEHLALTHSDLRRAGGALGAGILALLPDGACGLCETARVARALAAESAGQCGPCEHGLPAVANDLLLLCHGRDPDARKRALRRMLQIEGRGACRHPDGVVRLVRSAFATFAEHVRVHELHGSCAGMQRSPLLPIPPRPAAGEAWR